MVQPVLMVSQDQAMTSWGIARVIREPFRPFKLLYVASIQC